MPSIQGAALGDEAGGVPVRVACEGGQSEKRQGGEGGVGAPPPVTYTRCNLGKAHSEKVGADVEEDAEP